MALQWTRYADGGQRARWLPRLRQCGLQRMALLLRSTWREAIAPTSMLIPVTTTDERMAKATISFSLSDGRYPDLTGALPKSASS